MNMQAENQNSMKVSEYVGRAAVRQCSKIVYFEAVEHVELGYPSCAFPCFHAVL